MRRDIVGHADEAWLDMAPQRKGRGGVPAGDAAADHGPLIAVDSMRGEDLLVLLLRERPTLHRRVQLVAPPVTNGAEVKVR